MRRAPVRIIAINLVLLAAIGGLGYWGYSTLHPAVKATPLSTVTVSKGDVSASVSASGKVVSPADVALAPTVAGTLKSLNVKVGDHVRAGQVLAQLDTLSLQGALAQANQSLITAKSNIAALVPTKTAAEAAQANLQLSQAQAAIDLAKTNLASQSAAISAKAVNYQASVDAAKKSLDDATANAALAAKTYQASVDSAKQNLDTANLNYNNYEGLYGPAGITLAFCQSINTINANCTTLMSDYNAVQSATSSLATAQTNQTLSLAKDAQNLASLQSAYNNALATQKQSLTADALSITSYQNQVQSAQNSYDTLVASQAVANQPAKQSAIDTANAALQVAQNNYDIAKRNFDGATVVAPVAGDVASISTAVGGQVSTNTTQGTATTSAAGFIVLTNTTSLEVTASFSEADSAKLAVGQTTTFTFDALTNQSATGKLIQIDLLPTSSSGATTYGATFSLDAAVPGLKPGMTATATVITGSATNVIQISATAVTTRGTNAFVNLVRTINGKQVQTPQTVVIGLRGDSADEITSGLKVGDVVALPQTIRTSASNGFAVGGVPSGFGALAGAGGGVGGGARGGFGG